MPLPPFFSSQVRPPQRIPGARQLRNALLDVMGEIGDDIKNEFDETTETWRTRSVFTKSVELRGDFVTLEIVTEDDIYKFLNYGTKIRYATMSTDWVSKTMPNQLKPGRGRGRKKYVNTQIPRPGIEPRNWEKIIAGKWNRRVNREITTRLARRFFGFGIGF